MQLTKLRCCPINQTHCSEKYWQKSHLSFPFVNFKLSPPLHRISALTFFRFRRLFLFYETHCIFSPSFLSSSPLPFCYSDWQTNRYITKQVSLMRSRETDDRRNTECERIWALHIVETEIAFKIRGIVTEGTKRKIRGANWFCSFLVTK